MWVGINERFSQPWWQLGRRGVRRIYYRTEPEHCTPEKLSSAPTPHGADEVWDFSHHNLDGCVEPQGAGSAQPRARPGACDRCPGRARRQEPLTQPPPTLRVVPPGYLPPPWSVEDALQEAAANASSATAAALATSSAASSAAAPAAASAPPLIFFGSLDGWAGRRRCFRQLQSQLGASLQHVYHVWGDAQYAALLRAQPLYVNLHKGCEDGHAPVTFRHAQLLSAARLVVSPRAHPLDEAMYAGLVTFVPLERIARTHGEWAALPAARRVALQRSTWEDFRRRFAPRRLFEEAGVYEQLRIPQRERRIRAAHWGAASAGF